MKGIVFNNWTIETIISDMSSTSPEFSSELIGLLEALVLWDDVYYFNNGYNEYWKHCAENAKELNFLNMLKEIRIDENCVLKNAEQKYLKEYAEKYTSLVAQGALEYLDMCSEKELSYMPFGERANFVRTNGLYGIYKEFYNRMDAIQQVDKDLFEYYKYLNELVSKTKLGIKPHCIFNRISENASCMDEIMKNITDLRRSSMVKAFKNWVADFEDDIRKGKDIRIAQYANELKYIEEDLITSRKKIDTNFELNFPWGIGISVALPLVKKTPNLVFPTYLYAKGIGLKK